MYTRILKPNTQSSFFLFGPRGTGKTTWVRNTYPEAIYIDLLEAELYNNLLANPQRLESYFTLPMPEYVIIDEVQRVPQLLNEVHKQIEQSKVKFILTGSSARKLRQKGENLLAGRAYTYYMHPLTAVEIGEDFDIEKSATYGHLPSAYKASDPKKYLKSYVQTYLEEEISQEGLTRNLPAFARFLETASFSQGSVVNISEVARDAMIERKSAENYFKILEDLLIGYRIPVFRKRAKRRLIAHPKFYFFDTGIYKAVRPMGPLDEPEMVQGIALETLFLQDLIAVNQALGLGYEIYFYRTNDGSEVDFIAYGERGIKAFEIKSARHFSSSHVRGLRSFIQDYPEAQCYLINNGTRRLREGSVNVIPFADALKSLPLLLTESVLEERGT